MFKIKIIIKIRLFLLFIIVLSFSVFSQAEKKEITGMSYDALCRHIESLPDKSLIDNTTSESCKNLKEEKKAIGKGKLKKPKGIEIKENRIIEKQGKATVKFKNSFDIEVEDADEAAAENPNIYISNDMVAIDTDEIPELNQPATITFYNLTFESTPAIYYNEEFTTNPSEITKPCPEDICSNINYDKETGTLTFDVAHFSTYSALNWGGYRGRCENYYEDYCASHPDDCRINAYPYNGSVECKPTAFCGKYLDCWTVAREDFLGSVDRAFYWGELHSCFYRPSAGTENEICDRYDRIIIKYDEPCPEGFVQGHANKDYNAKFCSKTETNCSTCVGTKACNKDYCFASSWNSCYKKCLTEIGSVFTCFPAGFSAYNDPCGMSANNYCGGFSQLGGGRLGIDRLGIDWGTPESYYCQPKTCSSPTGNIGDCYYEEIYENKIYNYTIGIGSAICPKTTKKWKICGNTDGEPCGEWIDTVYGCYAERNETELECKDDLGKYRDYCKDNETLNRYDILREDHTNKTYDVFGLPYNYTVTEVSCYIEDPIEQYIERNCTIFGQVCTAAKRKCNYLPTAYVGLGTNINDAAYTDRYGNPLDNADLNCTAYITDYDEGDKTLYGKYEIIKQDAYGRITLKSGTASCDKSLEYTDMYDATTTCSINIPIVSNTDTSLGDVIFCSVVPNDGYADGNPSKDTVIIAPINLTVDINYLEDKSINVSEYLAPVQINENGQLKNYVVGTEYDTLVCRADGLTGDVNFEMLKGDYRLLGTKQVNCTSGFGCKAIFEVGENETIKGWPRGEKITCRANAIINEKQLMAESEKLVIAKYNYIFAIMGEYGSLSSLKAQYKTYVSLSEINKKIAVVGKPIYFGIGIPFPNDKNIIRDDGKRMIWIKDHIDEKKIRYDKTKNDKIIVMSKIVMFSFLLGTTTGFVVNSGDLLIYLDINSTHDVFAHEMGHASLNSNLCDEYHASDWDSENEKLLLDYGTGCPNNFPKCCGGECLMNGGIFLDNCNKYNLQKIELNSPLPTNYECCKKCDVSNPNSCPENYICGFNGICFNCAQFEGAIEGSKCVLLSIRAKITEKCRNTDNDCKAPFYVFHKGYENRIIQPCIDCTLLGLKCEGTCEPTPLHESLGCGYYSLCKGMPYEVDKTTKDETYPGQDPILYGPEQSIMGRGSRSLYPIEAKCPLRNC